MKDSFYQVLIRQKGYSKGGATLEKKNCWNCGFYKEYINRRKMEEINTDKVIYYHHCENPNTHSEIKDLEIANKCKYYDDDSWMK